MADIENAGGSDDVFATAEPHETSELGFTCGVACMGTVVLVVSLSEALLLLHYLAATATMAPFSVAPRVLAGTGLLVGALGVALGAVCCYTAFDLCLHGNTRGERQKNGPPPVHAAMD